MNKYRKRYKKPVSPKVLTLLPEDEWPEEWVSVAFDKPVEIWISRTYLVQIFDESKQLDSMLRLAINYTRYNSKGWHDGLSWDELMQCKHDVGYGDYYAIEIFPRAKDVINIANIRHLWVLAEPLTIGWFPSEKK